MATSLSPTGHPDVVLVGAGIMSATLAVILKELDPSLKIEIYEVLGSAAQESSNAWNNAGTGHAALCELNYTPEKSDGSIDISKALPVNTEFDLSRQLWAYLVKKGAIKDPQSFIHPVPHFSFVRGSENVAFLRKRFEALSAHHLYHGMEYSADKKQIEEWVPLVMEGRDPGEVIAATRMVTGTDVDYGALTNVLLDSLSGKEGFSIHFYNRVQDLRRDGDRWSVRVRDEKSGNHWDVQAKFVFLGAGGGSLPLLQKSGIPEWHGYAGFPVSGVWLRSDDPGIPGDSRTCPIRYSVSATLSLPTANIGNRFSGSMEPKRSKYDPRLAALREFFPNARQEDWRSEVAGQRVQIIKKDPTHGGILQFGTELVGSADDSIIAMLGASPGASTAVWIMLEVIKRCFAEKLKDEGWSAKLKEMIPSYGQSLIENAALCRQVRAETAAVLKINDIAS
jgi:malate dehydrogenase (quinone)